MNGGHRVGLRSHTTRIECEPLPLTARAASSARAPARCTGPRSGLARAKRIEGDVRAVATCGVERFGESITEPTSDRLGVAREPGIEQCSGGDRETMRLAQPSGESPTAARGRHAPRAAVPRAPQSGASERRESLVPVRTPRSGRSTGTTDDRLMVLATGQDRGAIESPEKDEARSDIEIHAARLDVVPRASLLFAPDRIVRAGSCPVDSERRRAERARTADLGRRERARERPAGSTNEVVEHRERRRDTSHGACSGALSRVHASSL